MKGKPESNYYRDLTCWKALRLAGMCEDCAMCQNATCDLPEARTGRKRYLGKEIRIKETELKTLKQRHRLL